MYKKRQKKGFTLIELLVVIAIIALLLNIIMPALKRVKEAGKRTLCLVNVKTLSIAYVIYLDDYVNDWNASWFVPATAMYWWNSTPIRHGSGGNV